MIYSLICNENILVLIFTLSSEKKKQYNFTKSMMKKCFVRFFLDIHFLNTYFQMLPLFLFDSYANNYSEFYYFFRKFHMEKHFFRFLRVHLRCSCCWRIVLSETKVCFVFVLYSVYKLNLSIVLTSIIC